MRRGEELLVVQADAECHSAQQFSSSPMTLPVEIRHEAAKARQDVLGKPLIRLVCILLAADFVAFLWYLIADRAFLAGYLP